MKSWIFDLSQLASACRWIGISEEVTQAFCSTAGRLALAPAWEDKLEKSRAKLLGEKQAPEFNEVEPMFPALVFLSILPEVQTRDRARGIPENVTKESLFDIEIWIRQFYQAHGRWGLGNVRWPVTYFTGRLYALGRLQFEMTAFPESCCSDGAIPFTPGDPVLSVHIPASGKLDDADCEWSFRQAYEFFPSFFPEHAFKGLICISWMMNRQLEVALPKSSNLVRFIRRFKPLAFKDADDKQAWERVFGGPVSDFASAPRDTALRRALLAHAEAGGKWLSAAGYIEREIPV